MLCLNHLTTGYGRKIIGHDLCATLRPATLTALLGPNGSGKSTLLRTIAGLQKPAEMPRHGESQAIKLNGKTLTGLPPREMARLLSIVLTFRPESDALTAGEVVEMGRIPYARTFSRMDSEDRLMVEKALELTATKDLRHRPISQLSDGERQRVFIAKALAQNTPLILLDEPTAFLDFPTKVATLRLLARLAHKEGKTVLVSTHDVEHALVFSDQLWLLRSDGIMSGTPHELAQRGTLQTFFKADGISFDNRTMRFAFNDPKDINAPKALKASNLDNL